MSELTSDLKDFSVSARHHKPQTRQHQHHDPGLGKDEGRGKQAGRGRIPVKPRKMRYSSMILSDDAMASRRDAIVAISEASLTMIFVQPGWSNFQSDRVITPGEGSGHRGLCGSLCLLGWTGQKRGGCAFKPPVNDFGIVQAEATRPPRQTSIDIVVPQPQGLSVSQEGPLMWAWP